MQSVIMMSIVESLVHQCQFYILMHLEEFPVSHLSLLPLSTRKALLWQLPLTDVFQLQDTKFTEGLETEVVDCILSRCDTYIGTADEDRDVEEYIENRWKNGMAYAREILYGKLVTSLLGWQHDINFCFNLPNGGHTQLSYYDNNDDHIIDFLCGIRKEYQSRPLSAYSFIVPPRHNIRLIHQCNQSLVFIIEQLVRYFNDKHPKVLDGLCIPVRLPAYFLPFLNGDGVVELPILREVEQLGFEYNPFEPTAAECIAMTVSNAKCLEVLVLKGCEESPDAPICVDTLCDDLSACTTFWSTFRIFKILSRPGYDDSGFETSIIKYVISRVTFDELIKAYFAAPTDHKQLVQFTDTKIEGDSSDHSPAINTTYLKFKTVRLENCHFVSSSKATPGIIANWLGREIDILENKSDSCLFQVKDSGKRGQKRKYSEE